MRRYRMSPIMALAVGLLLSGCVTLAALWCQPNRLRDVLGIFLQKPVLIVLNVLPVGLLLLALACLLRNPFYAGAVVNLAVCGLSIANRIKIEVRDEPLFPRDFALLKEVGSAMGSYHIQLPVKLIVVVLLLSLAMAGLGVWIGCRPFPVKILRGWWGRLLGGAAGFGALVLAIVTALGSDSLYQSIGASNPYRMSVLFNETGFPYSFCHQFTTYLVDKPDGFNRSEAESWETEGTYGQGKPVSVIMVMNEAFSDITDHPAFTYGAGSDPLSNLHALQEDAHSISGHVIVPGFAGGTANTEFDVLTGMQTNALSATTTSAMRVVNRNLNSLFRVFGADGYRTSFIHPGDDWFYNRENVYRWLGAEESLFVDEMEAVQYKGRWVTDGYTAGLIEQALQTAAASGQPLFNYTTTIQNHMSYTADKYGEGYPFQPLEVSAPLSEQAQMLLEVYIEGVRDADAMLGRLQRTFEASEAPVLLIFFGDHLPYLGDQQLVYRELGMDVDSLSGYETPYVIWANDAAAEMLDWERAVDALALPENGQLSASFLGAAILELTGRSGENPWFDFLNQLRRTAPVVQRDICTAPDGSLLQAHEPPLSELLSKWRCWSYYKLQYQGALPPEPSLPFS